MKKERLVVWPLCQHVAMTMLQVFVSLFLTSLPFAQASVLIVNATELITTSIGNTNYDHQVIVENNADDALDDVLIFRWDDPTDGVLNASLEHTTKSENTKPSWLALGFFGANRNTVPIFDDILEEVNGQAVVGTMFYGTPAVFKYSLGNPHGKMTANNTLGGVGLMPDEHQTLIYESLEQGTVTLADGTEAIRTVLMFAKNMDEGTDREEAVLKENGDNIFLWAIGPTGMERLGMHDQRGAFRLNFQQQSTQVAPQTQTPESQQERPEATPEPGASPEAPASAPRTDILNATDIFQPIDETSPENGYKEFDHQVFVDKNLMLFWTNPADGVLNARLEHKAESMDTAPSWLSFGFYDVMGNDEPVTSANFVMDGSTAIIGKTWEEGPPLLYNLGYNHDQPGIIQPMEEQHLIESSLLQFPDTEEGVVYTALSFKKNMRNYGPNEPPVVAAGDDVFLWAMGPPKADNLGMHSEYGVIRLDFSIAAKTTSNNDSGNGITHVPTIEPVTVVDATVQFVTSVDPAYDYQIQLEEDVIFRWETPDEETGIFTGRLEHTTKFIEAAPAWLGFGFPNPTDTSTWMLMQNTYAVIGLLPSEKVEKYSLGVNNNHTTGFVQALPLEQQTLKASKMLQSHNPDTGIYTTSLTFAKLLVEEINPLEAPIWTNGENRFLWAVGNALTASATLGMHRTFGAIIVDFARVEKKANNQPPPLPSPAPASDTNSNNADADRYKAPIVEGECYSSVFEKSGKSMKLTPDLTMHWVLHDVDDDGIAEFGGVPSITILLEYSGIAWLAFGFSPTSQAHNPGSTAVIGIPPTKDTPQLKYNITALNVEDTLPMADQTLIDSFVNQEEGIPGLTTLQFTKALQDGIREEQIKPKGLNFFSFAVGAGNALGYHRQRESFQLDLSECYDHPPNYDPSAQKADGSRNGGKSGKGALTAHAIMAAIAWGFSMPCAVGMAWFRQLIPTTWIYIHVSFNLLTFVMTLLAVLVGVAAVSSRDNSSHFSKGHHVVGVLLFVTYTFQVGNGFLRPPVQRKDDGTPVERKPFSTNKPESAREWWHLIHRSIGIIMLLAGIFQIASGMRLYDENFESGRDSFFWYWAYVSLICLAMLFLKIWLVIQNRKARGESASWIEDRAATSVGIDTYMASDPNGMDMDGDCVVLEIPSRSGAESTVIRGARRTSHIPATSSPHDISESTDDDNMTVEIT